MRTPQRLRRNELRHSPPRAGINAALQPGFLRAAAVTDNRKPIEGFRALANVHLRLRLRPTEFRVVSAG